jgi:hypothetical protein
VAGIVGWRGSAIGLAWLSFGWGGVMMVMSLPYHWCRAAQLSSGVILLNICLVQELVEKSKGILLGIIKRHIPLQMLVPDDVVEYRL